MATVGEGEKCVEAETEMGNTDMLTGMDKDTSWLSRFEQQFVQVAGDDRDIYLEEFTKALNVKKSFFAERFFHLIDTDSSGSISLKELLVALRLLVHGSATDKLRFLFRVYDVDGNGSIDFSELRTVLKSCTAESALQLSEETLDELTDVLFQEADADGNGTISFEELREQLEKYPDIADNLTISAADWLRPPSSSVNTKVKVGRCGRFLPRIVDTKRLRNNRSTIIFVTFYLLLHAGLIVWGVLESWNKFPDRSWLMVARGAGRCLSFDCVFILCLMLRKCLTLIRSTNVTIALDLIDQHVDFHKLVGYFIVGLSIIHILGHVLNYADLSSGPSNYSIAEYLFTTSPGIGWVAGTANVTGDVIAIILIIIFVFSFSFIRRRGYFQVFYMTHQFFIFFWILLILHARTFWMWFVLPGTLYIIERILRLKLVRRVRGGRMYIKKAVVLPANVTLLIIPRPTNLRFHPGEYVHINIPTIAKNEWHPFTISSAPEQKGFITLHIRAIGNWTKRLHTVCKQRQDKEEASFENPAIDGKESKALDVLAEEGSLKSPEMSPKREKSTTGGEDNKLGLDVPGTPINEDTQIGIDEKGIDKHSNVKSHLVLVEQKNRLSHPSNADSGIDTKESTKGNPVSGNVVLPPINRMSSAISECHAQDGTSVKEAAGSEEISRMDSGVFTEHKAISVASVPGGSNPTVKPASQTRGFVSWDRRSPPVSRRRSSSFNRKLTQHSLDVVQSLANSDEHTGIEVYIDGPYGAPSQHIFESDHAVLIGAGIGVTPFASILQSIHERHKMATKRCKNCNFAWLEDTPSLLRLKRVDFFWITRQQSSFEWFLSLLNHIELEQEEMMSSQKFININLYMTAALGKHDMKAIGLHMALDLIHKKKQRDTITGLMTRTQAGRPDWKRVFDDIARHKRGKVSVFFCGSPSLGEVIKRKSQEHGFGFRKENF